MIKINPDIEINDDDKKYKTQNNINNITFNHFGATNIIKIDNENEKVDKENEQINDNSYEKVELISINSYIDELKNKNEILNGLNIFKIDVEGFELDVLQGMTNVLDKNLVIIYEYNERQKKYHRRK